MKILAFRIMTPCRFVLGTSVTFQGTLDYTEDVGSEAVWKVGTLYRVAQKERMFFK